MRNFKRALVAFIAEMLLGDDEDRRIVAEAITQPDAATPARGAPGSLYLCHVCNDKGFGHYGNPPCPGCGW